jgi:translation initiation factor IF-3
VNQQIHAPQVRLIDEEGNQVGVVNIREALISAERASLDLVEISPNTEPPVCRIMDYGKYRFEKGKKQAAQKKKQRRVQVKEIKFRPVTDIGDYQVKVRKIIEFLERGDKVKISLRFRGREMQHRELGMGLLTRIRSDLPAGLVVEQEAKIEGRQMGMVVSLGKHDVKPVKKSEEG